LLIKQRFFILLILIFIVSQLAGCQSKQVAGVLFTNESLLTQMGLMVPLNQEVDLGYTKIVLEKAVFDRNAIVFAYKGEDIAASAAAFVVNGDQIPGAIEPSDAGTPLGRVSSSGHHVLSIPHHLELKKQEITLEVNMNGHDNVIPLTFPGDTVALMTAEWTVDAAGQIVNDGVFDTRVIVGIGSCKIENSGGRNYLLVDKPNQAILAKYSIQTAGSSVVEVFDAPTFPRDDV
jgi:hypothetical protein